MTIDVQAAQPSVGLPAGHSGRLKFKVQNMSQEPLVVVGTVSPSGPTPPEWVTTDRLLVDRPQRTLAAQAMDEFVVEVSPPLGSAPGHYPFSLRVAPVDTAAVQLWGESSQVTVMVEANEAPATPSWPKWLALVAAILLGIGVGAVAFTVLDGRQSWSQTSVTESTTLGPGEQLKVGIANNSGDAQGIRFEPPLLQVVKGPLVTLSDAGTGDEGQRCADELEETAASARREPVPIDGRPLCFFIGEDQIAVARVLGLDGVDITLAIDSWRLS